MNAADADATPASTCPRCGAAFACGARGAGPCACAGVTLAPARLAELRARWATCLCGACLATLAARPEMPA